MADRYLLVEIGSKEFTGLAYMRVQNGVVVDYRNADTGALLFDNLPTGAKTAIVTVTDDTLAVKGKEAYRGEVVEPAWAATADYKPYDVNQKGDRRSGKERRA